MSRRGWFVTVMVGALAAFSWAQAQEGGAGAGQDGARPQRGDRQRGERGERRGRAEGAGAGGGGAWDPAAMRERQVDYIKSQLRVTEEEWTALKPKVEKVMTLQREVRPMGGGMMMGGRGRGPGAAGGEGKAMEAQRELRSTLDNVGASDADITAKLTALREARAKAKTQLEAAQKDLKSGLKPRHEAVLVMSGLLD